MEITSRGSLTVMSAEGLAKEFLLRFWDQQLPVDPIKIATAYGAQVFQRGNFGDEGWQFSGYFHYRDGIQPTIEYNATEPRTRQRFTIAHELGHFALGHRDAPRDSGNFQASGDFKEVSANRFAAELLMPSELVTHYYRNGLVNSIDDLAMTFGVSRDAMGYRLINLGLI